MKKANTILIINNFKEWLQKDMYKRIDLLLHLLGIITLIMSTTLSSLSTGREGEEGESKYLNFRY